MAHTTFDTLAYANKLKAAGADSRLAEVQAEATAEIIGGLMDNQLATKQDLLALEMKLSGLYLKMTVGSVSILIALQTLLHFVK
jgi:hypothetical protein